MTTALAALIEQHQKGRTVRQLERDGELPAGAIANYLKPSARVVRPRLATQQGIAKALEVDLDVVFQAVRLDTTGSSAPRALSPGNLSVEQVEVAQLMEHLDGDEQRLVRGVAHAVAAWALTRAGEGSRVDAPTPSDKG